MKYALARLDGWKPQRLGTRLFRADQLEDAGLEAFRHRVGRDISAFPQESPMGLVPVEDTTTKPDPLQRFRDARIEGYWRQHEDLYPAPLRDDRHLPWPEVQDFPDRARFLDALAQMEASLKPMGYMGTSACRLCQKTNGSREFFDPNPAGIHGWRWPEGFAHYVRDHHVRPSLAFEMFVVLRARNFPYKA